MGNGKSYGHMRLSYPSHRNSDACNRTVASHYRFLTAADSTGYAR